MYPKATPQFTQCVLATTRAGKARQGNTASKYTVDEIIRHVGTGKNIQYVVWWHRYTASNDTIEPPDHIPQQFNACYWSEKKSSAKRPPRLTDR